VERARSALDVSALRLRETEAKLHQSVLAAAAAVAVAFQQLPAKLNPIIQPLMAATRRERDEELQSEAAKAIAKLVKRAMSREKSPSGKICSNIFTMACSCPETTPVATESGEKKQEVVAHAQTTTTTGKSTKTNVSSGGAKKMDDATAAAADVVDTDVPETVIAARGGAKALREFCQEFGDGVFTKLPTLMTPINDSLALVNANNANAGGQLEATARQTISNSCRVVSIVAEACTQTAFEVHLRPLTSKIFAAASSLKCHSVKTTASNALAAMTTAHPDDTLPEILALLAPALEGGDLEQHASPTARLGAAFVALSVTESVPDSIIAPYCVLLLVPLMSRMSDSNVEVRSAATKAFAALVPLLPLARGAAPPAKLSAAQKKRSGDDGAFLEALLDNTKIDNFELPFKCKYQLRPYQRDGVNWLAFLRRFKLHGALCDDMGLGKTLQSTCILASSTVERRAKGLPIMPHLIICPPTLVGHWAHEISMYTEDPNLLSVCEYQGSPAERQALQNDARTKYDVVVASYDSVRADAQSFFHAVDWCYCVLDEGHAIRNPKSRVCLAVKQVKAEHRLLLSGTPIQNDVVELWSLFDFLMPGFLGTEREFKENYGIAAARSKAAKKGGGLTEQGALTVGRLHKQVMPFVLRRTKDQVLKDLPPKIIQDVFVDLTAAQRRLYDNFETSGAKEDVSKALVSGSSGAGGGGDGAPVHVFQALQYLRKLCSHPRLVDGSLNEKSSAKSVAKRSDDDMNWSPKFEALKQILLDCGIGRDAHADDDGDNGEATNNQSESKQGGNHRVLVFAQLKSLLDLVEEELFTSHMKDVSWLRLDGSVPAHERFNVARKFNADPTIDVLLLTTHVGGLGLNLTTADTVVFLEHDWNPQKDLQAMDRAHRLGQKKTVNVYRILTRGTIEEKVMSLQRFKLDVANAVVNADNASMKSMDTGAMLELFTAEKGKKAKLDAEKKAHAEGGNGGEDQGQTQNAPMKQILNGLDELWAQSQYDEEFDVEQFQKTFGGKRE
jgi:TATA-binding protein-associated factor